MGQGDEYATLDGHYEAQLRAFTLATNVMLGYLDQLPVPIGVGREADDSLTPEHLIEAVSRARKLVMEEPIEYTSRILLELVLVRWLMAWQLLDSTRIMGLAGWRIDVIDSAIMSLTEQLRQLGLVVPKPGQD